MPIEMQCKNPACPKTFRVKDDLAGRRVKCPGCGHLMRVPSTEPMPLCNLCGSAELELVPFYLRVLSSSAQGRKVTTRWIDFDAECCPACFRQVLRLQNAYAASNATALGSALLGCVLFFLGKGGKGGLLLDPLILSFLAIAFIGFVCGSIGSIVISSKRGRLTDTAYFVPTLNRLKSFQAVQVRPGAPIRVIPLAKVSGSVVYEWDR